MFICIYLFVAGLNKSKNKSPVHDGQQIVEEKRKTGVEPLDHFRVLQRRKRKPESRWRTLCVFKQTRGRRAGGWAGLSVIVCHHLLEAGDYITSDCADQCRHVIHEALGEAILPRCIQFVSKIQMMHHALHLGGYKLQHSHSQLLLVVWKQGLGGIREVFAHHQLEEEPGLLQGRLPHAPAAHNPLQGQLLVEKLQSQTQSQPEPPEQLPTQPPWEMSARSMASVANNEFSKLNNWGHDSSGGIPERNPQLTMRDEVMTCDGRNVSQHLAPGLNLKCQKNFSAHPQK